MKIKEIIDELSRPWMEYESTKTISNTPLTYISWFNRVKIMHILGIDWDKDIQDISTGDKRIYICRLTIHADEGSYTRSATGIEDDATNSFGDPSSNAEAMAFSRATANFGLGLYLYDKKGGKAPVKSFRTAPKGMQGNATADKATPVNEAPWPDEDPFAEEPETKVDGCDTCNVKFDSKGGTYTSCWDCKQKKMTGTCTGCGKATDPKYPTCWDCKNK